MVGGGREGFYPDQDFKEGNDIHLGVDHGKENGALEADRPLEAEDCLGHPCTPEFALSSNIKL